VPAVPLRPANVDIPNAQFNILAFRTPAPGTWGNAGRNILKGPAAYNWDFSLFKNYRVREHQSVEFRAEMFNLFNTPEFGLPGGNLSAPLPGFTWAYPRILAGSGVKRLVTGLNLFIGGDKSLGVSQNPFYWVGPDGSRVLTYFTYDSYMEGYRWKLSGRFSLDELEKTVPRRLAWLEKNGYKYDTYLLMSSAGTTCIRKAHSEPCSASGNGTVSILNYP
jgi:hypothetical protein